MAGALSRRDIEMIFRAETDKATRPIGALTKDVKTLRGALEDQIKTTGKVEDALDGLAATTRDLQKAQDELGTARGLLTQLNAQAKALETAETRLAGATAKYDDLAARIAAAEAPSKRLTQQFEAAGRAQTAAAESLNRVKAETTETRSQIEAIIGPVENIGNAFRDIAVASKDISRGLAVAGTAAEEFKGKLAGVSAEQAKLAGDKAFQQQGLDAGLLQAQINYISQFENRVQLLNQAKAELTAQNAGFDKALQAQDAKVGAANVARLRDAFEEAAAAEAQMKQVTAFRQIATDANAALADVSRFGVSADVGAAATLRLGDALQAILNPTKAASASIEGMEASVTAAAGVLEGKGKKTVNEYAAATATLGEAAASAGRLAANVDGYRDQQAAVAKSSASFDKLRADAIAAATGLATADAPTQEMANNLKRLQAASDAAGNELKQESEKLTVLGAKLKAAGIDVNDLAAAEKRLTAVAKETAATQAAISQKTGSKGLFGLRPDELTNLGYQVNDIFTQLASGQSIFTTLAQQGPQIFQIGGVRAFIGALGPLLPILAAVAVAVGIVAAAISRMNTVAAESKAAAAFVAEIGEQGSLTADQMVKAQLAMEAFGVSSEDARKAVQEFSQAGLDPSYLQDYTKAAQDAALVTGNDFKDAFHDLTQAMTGGREQIDALLEKYPVLSDAERANIDDMIDQGNVSEARRILYEKFAAHMDDAAKKGGNGGEWSNAWINLKNTFNLFLDRLADAPIIIGGTITSLRQLKNEAADAVVGLNYLLLRAQGFTHAQAGDAAVNGGGRAPVKAGGPPRGKGPAATLPTTSPLGQRAIRDAQLDALPTKDQNKAQRGQVAYTKAYTAALDKQYTAQEAVTLATIARTKAEREFQDTADKKGAAAGRRAAAEARRDENAAKALAARIQSAQESLETNLDQLGAKVAKTTAGTLQDQLSAAADAVKLQYQKLFRQLDDYSKLTAGKGMVGKLTIQQARDQITANEAILTQQAQLKVYEDQINDTIKARNAELADIEDRAARNQISGADAIRETAEVTSKYEPLIADLSTAAIAFAKSIGGATPSAELKAFIAKMQSLGQKNQGDDQGAVRKAADANVNRQENQLNQILAQRNSLIETYNTLADLGVITQDEARKRSAAAYAEAAKAITDQIALVRQSVTAAHDLGAMNDLTYNAWIAKLDLVGKQAIYVDPRLKEMKSSIDNLITQNALNAIDKIAQAFGGLIAGTESFGSAIGKAALAFLSFIGDTILGIAKLILQMVILDAVQKITGIPVGALLRLTGGGGGGTGLLHGGGTVGSYSGGKQSTSRIGISPAAIASAPRYHEGTDAVGLKPNEQLAVLETGEKVTTEEQQRLEKKAASRKNGGTGTGLRQVLAFGDDQVAAAMAGSAGESVTVTHIRRNAPLIKQFLQD